MVSFIQYLLQSAAQGEVESEFILGLAYRDGWDGNVRPGSAAAKWSGLAAELGDLRPVLVLGLLEKYPDRVARDPGKAVAMLNRAAERGDDYARVILGDMLLEGDGVPADWRRGAEWIRRSATAGFAPAQFRQGLIFLVGNPATPKDQIEALAWFIIASASGSKVATAYRDELTDLLGRDAARLAIKRSQALLVQSGARNHPSPALAS